MKLNSNFKMLSIHNSAHSFRFLTMMIHFLYIYRNALECPEKSKIVQERMAGKNCREP